MAVELLIVLAGSKAPDWSSWNQALWDVRAPVSLARSVDLRRYTGYLPVRLQGRSTGFDFLTEAASDLAQYPQLASLPLTDPIAYSLSYGARPEECAAVFLTASVLVAKFNGVAFDPQQGLILSLDQVNDAATQCLGLIRR